MLVFCDFSQSSDIQGNTALHLSCLYGRKNIIEMLLDAGANLRSRDNAKTTPIHCSCIEGSTEVGAITSPCTIIEGALTIFYSGRDIFAPYCFFVINPSEKCFLFQINLTFSQNSLQITAKNLNLRRLRKVSQFLR